MKKNSIHLSLWGKLFIAVVLWTIEATYSIAQDNPYKIDNELYKYFVKINANIQKTSTMSLIDTMYVKAQHKKDVKAQCIAIAMRCKNYVMNNQFDKAKQIAASNKNFFFQSQQQQYYYYAIGSLIDRYIALKRYDVAVNEVNHFKEDAFKTKNDYAIASSYRYLGRIYYFSGNIQKAIENYEYAAKYLEKVGKVKEVDQCYIPLATLFYDEKNLEKAAYYTEKAKQYCHDPSRLMALYANLLISFVNSNQEAHADSLFKGYKDAARKTIMSKKNREAYYRAVSAYYRMKKDYEKSLAYADSISDPSISTNQKSLTYAMIPDYRQAYFFLKKNEQYRDSVNKKELADALIHSNAELNEQRLQLENNRLELQNAQMKLKQSEDQKRMLTMDRERNLLSLNNTQLELNNKNLKIKQSEMEIKQKEQQLKSEKERNEAEQEASRIRTILLYIISFSFLFCALLTVLFFHRRNIIIRKLKKEKQLAEEMHNEAERQKDIANIERERTEKALLIADTARIQAQEAQAKAESADMLKSQFLQNMSHEIRTPLNAIVGFTDLLNDSDAEFSSEERTEFLNLIHSNSELLTTLINDILDMSKLESGNYSLNISDVTAADLCATAVASVAHKAAPGVDMRFDMPKDKIKLPNGKPASELVLQTDGTRLQQILTNFLTNACKYTEKGSIVLTYDIQKNADKNRYDAVFSVTDTGSGIPIEKADTVFERFAKLDNFKQGTGLGLNICKRISDLMDGEIKVDTSYTQGARFIFSHPIN